MRAEIVYAFDSGQTANRFLNRLKSGEVEGVHAGLRMGGKAVAVSYTLTGGDAFSTTCAELDELASLLGGREQL